MKRILILLLLLVRISSSAATADSFYVYKGYWDLSLGVAYNLNSVKLFSSNNMQLYSEISTMHGFVMKDWFFGVGIGYYSSFRDKEIMYPVYVGGQYAFRNVRMNPFLEARAGIIYDPRWIQEVQEYVALSAGIQAFEGVQVGIRMSGFSRPSRFFTANAAFTISYSFGH